MDKDKEEETLLKARITTLEDCLRNTLQLLRDTIEINRMGMDKSSIPSVGFADVKYRVEKRLKKFMEDLGYQGQTEIELQKEKKQ